MGVSFHYKGRFKTGASLPSMIEEIKDIAEVYRWQYHVYESVFPPAVPGQAGSHQKIYGISFVPHGCETVCLCFLSNGKMGNPSKWQYYGNPPNQEEQDYLYLLSVKTQYAGVEVHTMIIHLLKHLDKKYFSDFELKDEGHYWETGDLSILQNSFSGHYYQTDNNITSSFKHYQPKPGEALDTYFERLLQQLYEKYKK
ncbi:MAG: hypothetical protein ABI813_02480 [Bacteroidota bacterium]